MKHKTILAFLGVAAAIAVFAYFLRGADLVILNPKGEIAEKQRDLIITAFGLMMLVVIPVIIMTLAIAWKYREDNKKATYMPNWDHNKAAESVWWGIPIVLICILSVMAWQSSHELDPFRPLSSDKKPVQVQVVALQWRWLFIYPEYNIASMNYVQFPKDTPVNFTITSDAPMNSLWIPQLGGQVYAMTGMTTKLHLQANQTGVFAGSSANLSGEGFAGMRFQAEATTDESFEAWIETVRQSEKTLSKETYTALARPSHDSDRQFFTSVDPKLFDGIIDTYMPYGHMHSGRHGMYVTKEGVR